MHQKNSRKEKKDVSRKDIWKKLQFIQEKMLEIEETQKEVQKKQKKIEKAVTPRGGKQPSQKGLKIFKENEEGKKEFTEVGEEIFKKIRRLESRKNRAFTRNDLEQILVKYDMTRSKPTHLKYLKDIAGELNSYFQEGDENFRAEFDSGSQGGRNGGKPARVILHHK
jgi:hypothetical protein